MTAAGSSRRRRRTAAAAGCSSVPASSSASPRAARSRSPTSASRLRETGLQLLVYVNTDRYCAKELVLYPGQTCPEHRHPPFEGSPGKEETFRCAAAWSTSTSKGADAGAGVRAPGDAYTVWHEVALRPGDQHTIRPACWFQAGPRGAVVSEFSSTSRDELDEFTDPAVRRATAVED